MVECRVVRRHGRRERPMGDRCVLRTLEKARSKLRGVICQGTNRGSPSLSILLYPGVWVLGLSGGMSGLETDCERT